MPGFTVYGADGRRVVRGFAESAARELAARINADSGETLTVVEDDAAFEGTDEVVVGTQATTPKRLGRGRKPATGEPEGEPEGETEKPDEGAED